jgi:hypothetical protein
MNQLLSGRVVVLFCLAAQAGSVVAGAQQQTATSVTSRGATAATKPGIADGASSPDEMGNRRPLYRLRKSDVIEIKFDFTPEFDQTLSVQPDGFITLRGLDELYVAGLTVAELRSTIRETYAPTLHDPEVTVTLKDFEKPYFIATGGRGSSRKVRITRRRHGHRRRSPGWRIHGAGQALRSDIVPANFR